MKQLNGAIDRIKGVLRVALLAAFFGCMGCVVGGGYGGAVVAVPGPDVYLFGGGFDRGREVHEYSHRGFESRAEAHHGGGERHR